MDPIKIGNLIKDLRIKKGLTQNEFANIYGVTYQAVSKWENGKCLPDVSILKDICKDNNISLDSILSGEIDKNNKLNKIYIISIIIILFATITILLVHFTKSSFNYKSVTSNCDDFNIYGSLVYDNNKSHLHLSNITYCGKENELYDNIECKLYEQIKGTLKVLDTCEYDFEGNISLEDYLKKIEFDLEDFSKVCKNYNSDSLYIEINATKDGKTTEYKIPLNINDSCKSN